MAKTKNYQTEKKDLQGSKVIVTSYQIGEKYFCHVSNEYPGATIARAKGPNRETAVSLALEKAFKRLQG